MKVSCDCGQPHPVNTTMAGMELSCPCGKTLRVPNLSQLRELSSEARIVENFSNSFFRFERGCFACGNKETGPAHLKIQYEPEHSAVEVKPMQVASIISLLLFGIIGVIGSVLLLFRNTERIKINDAKVILLPIELCTLCRKKQKKELRALCASVLRKDELGSELYEDYPDLVVRVVISK